jgi:hypothetical protein
MSDFCNEKIHSFLWWRASSLITRSECEAPLLVTCRLRSTRLVEHDRNAPYDTHKQRESLQPASRTTRRYTITRRSPGRPVDAQCMMIGGTNSSKSGGSHSPLLLHGPCALLCQHRLSRLLCPLHAALTQKCTCRVALHLLQEAATGRGHREQRAAADVLMQREFL